jgi:predicted nucleic acid-binding protein
MSAVEFIDTNIFVYSVDLDAPRKKETASALVKDIGYRRAGGLSVQVLSEFYCTTTRKLRYPLTSEEAVAIITEFETWAIHSPRFEDVRAAIKLAERYQLNYWDALIIRSAQRLHAAVLWSEDFSHGQRFDSVEVRNPFN